MNANILKEVIRDNIENAKEETRKKENEEIEKWGATREEYMTKIYSIIGGENPYNGEYFMVNDLIYEIKENTQGAFNFSEDEGKYYITEEEVKNYLGDWGQEKINEVLSQKEYQGLTFAEVATIMRYWDKLRQNEEIEYYANSHTDKYEEMSKEAAYEKILREEGYMSPSSMIEKVFAEEEEARVSVIEAECEQKFQDPEKIAEQINSDSRLNGADVHISGAEVAVLKKETHSVKEDLLLGKFLDFTAVKAALDTMEPNEFDESSMKILYDNGYKEPISNAQIAKMYGEYCVEQERAKQIAEKDTKIESQSNQIKDAQGKIAQLNNDIQQRDTKIKEQGDIIKGKDSKIEELDKAGQQKDQKIASQQFEMQQKDTKISQQKNEIQQLRQEKQNGDSQIEDLKRRISELERQNSQQLVEIKGLRQRNSFLESIISKQKAYMDSMIKNIRDIKSSVSVALEEIKPKKFLDKIVARFTRKKDNIIRGQNLNLMEYAMDAENQYQQAEMLQSTVGKSNEYMRQYMDRNSRNNRQNTHNYERNSFENR